MKADFLIKIFAVIAYVVMIVVNYLANALPINNIPTGAVSDLYPNLFAPAGITFSIWGIIYLLLGLFILYQFGVFGKIKFKKEKELLRKIGVYFIISSVANASWIFSWHYGLLGLSVLLMLTILFCLIKIADLLRKQRMNGKEYFFIKLPFSIYFGWITVATIANITAFLVSIGWNGFGIADNIWMIVALLLGTGIGIWRTVYDRNIAYALVFVWAYIGIIIKHTSEAGFNNQYPEIITATAICMLLFLTTIYVVIYKNCINKHKKV